MFSPRLASSGTQAGGGVCPLKGGGRVFCPGCPGGGGRERGAGASQNPYHLIWVTRYLLPMLPLHDQGRGPWIFLHVVSGPCNSFVAALDKGHAEKPYAGDTIIVEYKSTHIWFNYFSTWSENIELGFGYFYHHFIGFKPIHCILQFLFHVNWVVFFKILLTQISLQVCL